MRACSGCRKRKIKCDSATTNIWPCSACTRLKLVCVPPAIGQDGDFNTYDQAEEVAQPVSAVNSIQSPVADVAHQTNHHLQQQPLPYFASSSYPLESMRGYAEDPRLAHPQPYLGGSSQDQQRLYHHDSSLPLGFPTAHGYQQSQQHLPPASTLFPVPLTQNASGGANPESYLQHEQSTAEDLSNALGELKIDESGIGMNPVLSCARTVALGIFLLKKEKKILFQVNIHLVFGAFFSWSCGC